VLNSRHLVSWNLSSYRNRVEVSKPPRIDGCSVPTSWASTARLRLLRSANLYGDLDRVAPKLSLPFRRAARSSRTFLQIHTNVVTTFAMHRSRYLSRTNRICRNHCAQPPACVATIQQHDLGPIPRAAIASFRHRLLRFLRDRLALPVSAAVAVMTPDIARYRRTKEHASARRRRRAGKADGNGSTNRRNAATAVRAADQTRR